jgi:hypothetical protein
MNNIELTDKQIKYIKKYWLLKEQTIEKLKNYLKYINDEYENYLNNIGIYFGCNDYSEKMFNLINNNIDIYMDN